MGYGPEQEDANGDGDKTKRDFNNQLFLSWFSKTNHQNMNNRILNSSPYALKA